MSPVHGGGIATLMLVLLFACSSTVAEQPSWGWNDNRPPSAPPRGSSKQPSDVDPWLSGTNAAQDQWTPVGNSQGGGGQDPYDDQDYGYPSAPPPPPPPPAGGKEWEGEERRKGRAKAAKRAKKRGRSSGGGGGARNGDGRWDDEGDEEGGADLVEEYTRSFKGRVALSGSSSAVGAALGAMISKSTIQRTPMMSLVGLVVGLVLSIAKGAFGDLFRAMGLAALLAAHRSRRLSAEYPFLPYARRALAMLPRRPFPPAENPWKYKRAEALAEMEEAGVVDDGNLPAEFSMAKTLVSVAFLGGFVGYVVSQFVFLPTFLLALGGGGFLAYMATTRNARGDMTRLLGMRTVAFLGLVSEIDSDVALSTKARVVGGICFSKAMFWDSKYHIKDRVVVLLGNLYATIESLVRKAQRDAVNADGDESDSGDDEAFSEGDDRQQQPRGGRRRRRSRVSGDAPVEPPMPNSPPPPPPPPPRPSDFGEAGGGYQGGGDRDGYY